MFSFIDLWRLLPTFLFVIVEKKKKPVKRATAPTFNALMGKFATGAGRQVQRNRKTKGRKLPVSPEKVVQPQKYRGLTQSAKGDPTVEQKGESSEENVEGAPVGRNKLVFSLFLL